MQAPSQNLPENRKALALLSGGLDSALAAKMVRDWGIEVVGLHLSSPFSCESDVKAVAEELGIRLRIESKGEAYLSLIEKPQFGYGSAINPCVDCRIYMFQMAERIRQEEGASFVVTGEVLGQRLKSQVRSSIHTIDTHSPLGDRIVRPLSGQFFEATLPEKLGWITRKQLGRITGRSRKTQLQMKRDWGIEKTASPGGGCLLTESLFVKKLQDFFAHDDFANPTEKYAASQLLRYGRHFRLEDGVKAVVARTEAEGKQLERLWPETPGTLIRPLGFQGPLAVAFGAKTPESLDLVASLVLRFSKTKATLPAVFSYQSANSRGEVVAPEPLSEERVKAAYL